MVSIVDPALTPESGEARRCQFCAYRGKLTAEHIWPKQFHRVTPTIKRARYHKGTFGPQITDVIEWDARVFTATTRISCHRCNNEKLAAIEDDALPLFAAMATDSGVGVLRLDAQRKLAAFALRMFAVGQYTHPSTRPIPRHHREYVAEHRAPPPLVEVWAMAYSGAERSVQTTAAALRIGGPGEGIPYWANAYHAILRFGHLILEAAALTDGRPFPVRPADERTYVRLWPMEFNRIGVWPPVRGLGEDDFQYRLSTLWLNMDMRI